MKAILFDLWNVLGTKPSLSKRLAQHFEIYVDAAYLRKYENAIQQREFDDLQGLALAFLQAFDLVANEENLEYVMQAVEDGLEGSKMIGGVKELLEELHKSYKLGILSNTTNYESAAPVNWGIGVYFDAVTYSWQIGDGKPDAVAFEMALRKLGVAPVDCLFIDDKEANVEAARSLGMQAIQFINLEDLKSELRIKEILS